MTECSVVLRECGFTISFHITKSVPHCGFITLWSSVGNSPFVCLVTMCEYGKPHAVQGECTEQPQHKLETRLRKRCAHSPKPGAPCSEATHDPSLDQLNSRKGGACPGCRDSGIVVEVYQTKWVSEASTISSKPSS